MLLPCHKVNASNTSLTEIHAARQSSDLVLAIALAFLWFPFTQPLYYWQSSSPSCPPLELLAIKILQTAYARNALAHTATATSDAMAPAKATGIAKKSATRNKKQPPLAQPKELLEEDREHLRHWLSRTDKPFGVKVAALTRKRKRQEEMHVEEGLLVPDLRVLYAVKPRDKWDSLRKYKKFTGERVGK